MGQRNIVRKIFVFDDHKDIWSILKEITANKQVDEPFLLVDLNDIIQKHYDWMEAFPKISPFYAVKCNDNENAVKVLASLGVNFDCASKNEMDQILGLDLNPNRIIYANPNKSRTYVQYAKQVGVDLLVFDTESELHKIKELYPESRLVIRIKCDDPKIKIQFGAKFGCHHENEAPKILKTAKYLGLNVVGVCFHIGTGGYNPPIFELAIKYSKQVFDLAKSLGYNFTLLDIGGGFPGHHGYKLDEISKVINNSINFYFSNDEINVIGEPGRYYVASAFTSASKILSTHKTHVKDEKTGEMIKFTKYHMNDGVFGSFNTVLYNRIQAVPSLKPYEKNVELIKSNVWGPTCAGLDQVSFEVNLPDLDMDQWLFYESMGAYSNTMSTNFNGFTFTKEVCVINKKYWKVIKDSQQFNEDDFEVVTDIKQLVVECFDALKSN